MSFASKPDLVAVATGASEEGEAPASTRHEATSVAPFQLTAALTAPEPADLTASDGRPPGVALHGDRYVRKFCTSLPRVPSSSTCPAASNSVKLGRPPYPSSQLPPGRLSVLPWLAASSVFEGFTNCLTSATV